MPRTRTAAVALAAATGLALIGPAAAGLGAAAAQEFTAPPAAPQGGCGPGSIPEPGIQGRVPADDVAAGGAAEGYHCNIEVVGRHGPSGRYKVERYVDAAGHWLPRNEIGAPADVDGLVVLDVSSIQSRSAVPMPEVVGSTTWPTVTIPQAALPVSIDGKPYLVEMDEFASDGNRIAGNGERVGAGRIIDISDERNPEVVSDLRLEVHDPAVRDGLAGDPGAPSATGGYAGHYCAVPQREGPGIVACSFLASGLRVFDIRDPLAPKEVAYFVAPVEDGGPSNAAFSSASFVPERREIWSSDGGRGFYALRVTNDAWPVAGTATPSAGSTAPAPGHRDDAPAGRRTGAAGIFARRPAGQQPHQVAPQSELRAACQLASSSPCRPNISACSSGSSWS